MRNTYDDTCPFEPDEEQTGNPDDRQNQEKSPAGDLSDSQIVEQQDADDEQKGTEGQDADGR